MAQKELQWWLRRLHLPNQLHGNLCLPMSSVLCSSPVQIGLLPIYTIEQLPFRSLRTNIFLFFYSGIGLGTAQALIDDFLATRSLSSHLIVIPTTRSGSKSLETVRQLREYASKAAKTSKVLSRAGADYKWEDAVSRIHILSLTLDLCDLRGIRDFAHKLRYGTVSNPEGLKGEYLRNVRIPRLDSIICNAAFGGWAGMNYFAAIRSFFTKGIIQTATWPDFKLSLPTCLLNERPVLNYVSIFFRPCVVELRGAIRVYVLTVLSCSPSNLCWAKSFARVSLATTCSPISSFPC